MESEIINLDIKPKEAIDENYDKTTAAKEEKIKNLSTNEAPGPDKITNKIIKLLSKSLTPILYNIKLHKGYHSKILKAPNSPINSTNLINQLQTYRPISLINNLTSRKTNSKKNYQLGRRKQHNK